MIGSELSRLRDDISRAHRKRVIRGNGFAVLAALMVVGSSWADSKKQPPPAKPTPFDIAKALNVTQLKIDMAETNYRARPTARNLSDLTAALEEYLNTNCLKDLPKTLKYDGPPRDPECVGRMERLLEINPDNPAATCVRDGIEAPSCQAAYGQQTLVRFSPSTTEDLPDPALKVGLSAQETAQLDGYYRQLDSLQKAYEYAENDGARKKILEDAIPLYDNMLGLACRIVVLKLEPRAEVEKVKRDPKVEETRQKLLAIPRDLRADYQEKMVAELQEQLHLFKGSADERRKMEALLEVVKNPEGGAPATSATMDRKRYVLSQCVDLITMARRNLPPFPSPTCHEQGWYSPQCIAGLRQWKRAKMLKEQEKAMKEKKPGQPGGKPSIISSF